MPGLYRCNSLVNLNEFDNNALENNWAFLSSSDSMSYRDWETFREHSYEMAVCPIIRRIMPETISNRLYSVTPMEPPRDIDWHYKFTFEIPKKKKQMEMEIE